MKNAKGITLISLVITIIVLIILAGISISLMSGNDGILNKSRTASEEYNKQTATETMNLKITNVQISKYTEVQRMPTLKELADNFCEDNDFQYVQETSKLASLTKISNENPTSIYTKLKAYPYEFEINSSLQLASIDGIKIATVPTNDDDTIVSMTKAELQDLIDNSINNKLKNYSTTMAPTLDWNNKINITGNLNIIAGSFTAPKNGIVRVFLDQNIDSNCCLDLRTNATPSNYKKYYANSSTNWATFSDEFEINQSDSITVASDSILDGFRNFYLEFVPFK